MEIFLISDCFVRGLLEASKLQKKLLPFVYGGGGCDLFNDLYREVCPKGVPFFKLQVYEKVGISLVEVYGRIGKSVI